MFSNFLIWEEDMEAAGVTACGMFSPTHLIISAICLALLIFCVVRSRGLREEALNRIVRWLALPITALELCKIIFNWVHGGMTPNHWLPLTFCSFAIYAYWLIGFGNKAMRELGKGFICGGGIVAGFTFLLLPMTSVATYPMLHFLSCYSMLYHSVMMYVGLSYLVCGYYRFDRAGYRKFLLFCAPALGLALSVNLVYSIFDNITNCNMMFLSDPYRLAGMMPFIGTVYQAAPAVYTLGAVAVYLIIPYFLPCGIVKGIEALRGKRKTGEPVESETAV